jgi:multiple sugar transport system substrate-binding protein
MTRRGLLTAAGAGIAGAAAARLLTPWEAGAAPAQLRGSTLRILQWSHFVPAYDTWQPTYVQEHWAKPNGVNLEIDHITIDDLPARIASELSAGAGHDIIQMNGVIQTSVYYPHFVDISDILVPLGNQFGGWLPAAENVAMVDGRWYAYPDFYIPQPVLWRTDLFKEYGLQEPTTWDLARTAGRVGKAHGHPTGIQISHCNDSNHDWRAIFYSFGVEETDPTGKELRWDSPGLREALKFSRALYQEAMTPAVYTWDNVSDNRYLDSGTAIYIHDAISAIRSIQDSNPQLYSQVHVGVTPGLEPMGMVQKRFNVVDPAIYAIWNFSHNVPAAKSFIEWWGHQVPQAIDGSKGYNMPYLRDMYRKPMPAPLGTDPKVRALEDWLQVATVLGYPGPATAPASEVLATFAVPDLVAHYTQSGDLEGSIKTFMGQVRNIYSNYARKVK